MLRTLRIHNLVLVEKSVITFSSGFHVITGETGAGKSVLLSALGIILGDKLAPSSIRTGETTASIEAEFDLPKTPAIQNFFKEAKIPLPQKTILIRREISANSRTKTFLCEKPISLSLLQKLGPYLIELSHQHSYLNLQKPQAPQEFLDLFGKISVHSFQESYTQVCSLQKEIELLQSEIPLQATEKEAIIKKLEEIERSGILSTDDHSLFKEVQNFEKIKETLVLGSSIRAQLEEGEHPILQQLSLLKKDAHILCKEYEDLSATIDHWEESYHHLKAGYHILEEKLATLEYNEPRHLQLEEQLIAIHKLHRQYGSSQHVKETAEILQDRLLAIEKSEERFLLLQKEVLHEQETCHRLAQELRDQRTKAAPQLAAQIEKTLTTLNMPHVRFEITITSAPRSSSGDDLVNFWITPNVGERSVDVQNAVSGGELSRIFLALQASLANRSSVPTILFDELDAGIGGITAHAVGSLLATMGEERQVFAITHLVQVASKATTHIRLSKTTVNGRTTTQIEQLRSRQQKEKEHQRMVGIHGPS